MKRIFALLLVGVCVLTAFSLTSCGKRASKGLEFALNEDGASYSVVGKGTCEDTEVVIPDEYEGLPVTAIANDAMKKWGGLTAVTIPSSIQTIGSKAFYACPDLVTLTIEEGGSLTIGDEAFYQCSSLISITLPEGVTEIGDRVFAYSTHISEVNFPSTLTKVGAQVFMNCKKLELISFAGTLAQWEAIEFDKTWRQTAAIARIFCSDQTLSY